MTEEMKYTSKYDGQRSDDILDYANALKEQTPAEDGENVQVFDIDGTPHLISKTELLKKAALASPKLEDISSFVAVNSAGDIVGTMTKEQVTEVFRTEFVKLFPTLDSISAFATVNASGDGLGLTSKEKAAEVLGGLIPLAKLGQANGFMSKDGFFANGGSGHDANERISGVYFNPTANAPASYGILVSFCTNAQCLQFFYNAVNTTWHKRVYWESWKAWTTL